MTKARVLVLYTGGTIGMKRSAPDQPLRPAPLDQLLARVPALARIDIDITTRSLDPPRDSADIHPDHWLTMAETIHEHYHDHHGFVILHGTDTMAYTASGLAFILENLTKPVVITGSQLPLDDPRTDAIGNLVSSTLIAGYPAANLPRIPEVVLVFASRILRGCRATKVSSEKWEAFDSPRCPHLGQIGERIHIHRNRLRPALPPDQVELTLHSDLCPHVHIQTLYPGLSATRLTQILGGLPTKAVILQTFGAGTAPTGPEFLHTLAALQQSEPGKTFVSVSQCLDGIVDMHRYHAGAGLADNLISAQDMTTEAAYAKLVALINQGHTLQDHRRMILTNLRGEQSRSVHEIQWPNPQPGDAKPRHDLQPKPLPPFAPKRIDHAALRVTGLEFTHSRQPDPPAIHVELQDPTTSRSRPLPAATPLDLAHVPTPAPGRAPADGLPTPSGSDQLAQPAQHAQPSQPARRYDVTEALRALLDQPAQGASLRLTLSCPSADFRFATCRLSIVCDEPV